MKIAETRVAVHTHTHTHTHTSILKNIKKLAKKARLLNMSSFEIEENLSNA